MGALSSSTTLDSDRQSYIGQWKETQTCSLTTTFGAFKRDKVAGVCVTNSKQAGVSEIYHIAVFLEYQNSGVGLEVLQFVIRQLTESGLREVVSVLIQKRTERT